MSPTLGYEVDSFCSSANENNFIRRPCIQEPAYFVACGFVGIGRTCRERVGGTVDVGVFVLIEVRNTVDDCIRLLCCCRIVEPYQRTSPDLFLHELTAALDDVR